MLSSQLMKEKISENFKETIILKEGLLRCTREHSGKEISYYYIDHTQDIPESEVELKKFQDEILGVDYFSHSGEIQWNYYLLFVLDKNKYENMKDEYVVKNIESNKQYTRKFVLPLDEVNDFFNFNFIKSSKHDDLSSDLTTRWINALSEAGLNEIYGQTNRAQVIRNYLAGSQLTEEINIVTEVNPLESGKQISDLHLKNHRAYPIRREFEFKKMNLLVGPNGVGKTSLMEAIELVYCGGTLRGEGKTDLDSTIHFRYKDFTDFESFSASDNSKFQMRELLWYGKSVTRGNKLYENFNKYNFFNTDSAFQFSHDSSASEIDVAFSALALGERANYIDKRLRDFNDDFKDKKNSQDKVVKAIEKEVLEKELLIKQFSNIESNSAQIYDFVLMQANKLNIVNVFPLNSKEYTGNSRGDFLSIIYSVSQIVESGEWIVPLTLGNLRNLNAKYSDAKKQADVYEAQVIQRRNELLHLENSKKSLIDEANRYRRLSEYSHNETYKNFEASQKTLPVLQYEVKFISNLKFKIENVNFEILRQLNMNIPFGEVEQKILNEFDKINIEIRDLNVFLEKERERNNLSSKLLIEIKNLSKQLVHSDADITKCPVCNHLYELGELANVVSASDEINTSFDYSYLLKELKEKTDLKKIIEFEKSEFVKMNEVVETLATKDITILTINEFLDYCQKIDNEIADIEKKIKVCSQSIKDFYDHGFSSDEYTALLQLSNLNQDDLTVLSLNEKERAVTEHIGNNNTQEQKLKDQINQHLLDKNTFLLSLDMEQEESSKGIEQKINSIEYLLKEYNKIEEFIKIESNVDISHLLIELQEIQKTLTNFIIAQTTETSKNLELTQAQDKLKQLTSDLNQAKELFVKLEKGFSITSDLLLNDGKEKALSDFINKNRKLINSIFTRIHSPNEFQGLIPGTTNLVRKNSSTETPLSQVSTGQRAALAISVFLALNLSLKSAPPVILIDDPIAHIDDMNTLSFLDFLREVVIMSNRQVFFATASQKLASLIEKKFSFLDNEFKRYDLSR